MPWISAGASLVGGMMASDAAGDAADASSQASSAGIAEQRRQYDDVKGLTQPYRDTGGFANARLARLMGFGTEGADTPEYGSLTRKFSEADLASDVPYQTGLKFGLDQGTQAINNRAVASGGYDSGATLKALTRFANDYGSTKAGEASNRDTAYKSNVYGMLSGQQNVGMNANNTLAGTGQNTTNAITGLMTDQGDARASGIVGSANSMASAFGGIGSALKGYQNNQMVDRILKERGL
jgi:hypothetical protein